jgi:hypothetical protein
VIIQLCHGGAPNLQEILRTEQAIVEDNDDSRFVAQEPTYYKGSVVAASKFINDKIITLGLEPKLYFRHLFTEELEDEITSSFELVVTTGHRDDVRLQSENVTLFLDTIPHLKVETFLLYKNSIPEKLYPLLAKSFEKHSTLKRLWLKGGPPTDSEDIGYLIGASIIRVEGSPFQDLVVEGYDGGADGNSITDSRRDFFRALEQNTSFQALSFVKTVLLNTATMTSLGQALCINTSIKKLYLGCLDHVPEAGLLEFSKYLSTMQHLQVLDIRLVHRLVFTRPDQRPAKSKASFVAIIEALNENWSLEKIHGFRRYTKDLPLSLQSDMEYQLQLNRSCAKQFVRTPSTNSNIWPLILEKCKDNPTAMYYCLREKVVSVCTQ